MLSSLFGDLSGGWMGRDLMEPEILVNITFRIPQADRRALADHLVPVIKEAIIAGGDTVHISLQPYDPEEDPE